MHRIDCNGHLFRRTLTTHFVIGEGRGHLNMGNCIRVTIVFCCERRNIVGGTRSGKTNSGVAVRPHKACRTGRLIVRNKRHAVQRIVMTHISIRQRIHGSRRVHRDSERLGYTFANHSIVGAVRSHFNGSHSRSIRIIDSLERSNARTSSRSI